MSETLRRGLSSVYIAEVTVDDSGAYTVGKPEHLFPAGEMSRSVESEKASVYFDNVVFYTAGSESGTTVSITGADIRATKLAKILGKHIDASTGAIIDTGEYTEKYWALGGTAHKVDGTEEKFWMLKGTFGAPELSDKTIDDSTDTSGLTLEFTAIQTQHTFAVDGVQKHVKQVMIDTESTKLTNGNKWEDQVVTPENLAEIVTKVTA